VPGSNRRKNKNDVILSGRERTREIPLQSMEHVSGKVGHELLLSQCYEPSSAILFQTFSAHENEASLMVHRMGVKSQLRGANFASIARLDDQMYRSHSRFDCDSSSSRRFYQSSVSEGRFLWHHPVRSCRRFRSEI
jgi:hypothetical protein